MNLFSYKRRTTSYSLHIHLWATHFKVGVHSGYPQTTPFLGGERKRPPSDKSAHLPGRPLNLWAEAVASVGLSITIHWNYICSWITLWHAGWHGQPNPWPATRPSRRIWCQQQHQGRHKKHWESEEKQNQKSPQTHNNSRRLNKS